MALRRRGAVVVDYKVASWDAPSALPAWLTLTRATVGRYSDASNVLQSAAINAARMDYSTGVVGLIMEKARTNLFLRSDECANASWASANSTKTANQASGWAGAMTAATLTCANSTGVSAHQQGPFTVSSGATVTHSRVLAPGTNTSPYLSIYDNAHHQAQFVLSGNGSTANADAGVTARIRKVTTGLYLCSVTYTITGTSCYGTLFVSGHKSQNGTTGEYVYCDVAQLEVGAFSSSIVPTTTVAATRSGDALALGSGYASNPLIVETQSATTLAVSRTLYNPGSGISGLINSTNVWVRKAVVYAIGTPADVLNAVVAGGAW
jgi:hypothetical protein